MACDFQKVNLGVSWFIETARWCMNRKQLQLIWWWELLSSLSELRSCTCICLTGWCYSAAASLCYTKKSTGDFKEMLRTPRQYLLADLVGVSPPPPNPGSVHPDSPGAAGAHPVWGDREHPAGAPQHAEHTQTEKLRQWDNFTGGWVWSMKLVFNHKAEWGSAWKRSSVWDV